MHSGVTHVVAAKDGTDKCLAARNIPGCLLVKPAWLVECYWSSSRRDVQPHLFPGQGAAVAGTNINTSKQQPSQESMVDSNSGESTDSEDDGFAAAFENEMMDS
jgi:RNA polymerase II subunit A-like phosphatase